MCIKSNNDINNENNNDRNNDWDWSKVSSSSTFSILKTIKRPQNFKSFSTYFCLVYMEILKNFEVYLAFRKLVRKSLTAFTIWADVLLSLDGLISLSWNRCVCLKIGFAYTSSVIIGQETKLLQLWPYCWSDTCASIFAISWKVAKTVFSFYAIKQIILLSKLANENNKVNRTGFYPN